MMKSTSSSLSSAPNLRDRDKETQYSGSLKALASEKPFSHHHHHHHENNNGSLSNPLPPLSGGHMHFEVNGSNGKVPSRSRAHSSENIDARGTSEVVEHQPFISGVQTLQHMSTPSSTPQGTPHGTPSGFAIDGHSRKIKASSRRPLKQSTEHHITREKEDQSKLEPVKQVLFPIGSAAEPSEENTLSQLKKMPALISLTTSPTYTALSLNSTSVTTIPISAAGPAKKSSGGDVVNLIPILSSTSISSSSGFVNVAGIAAHDAPPSLTIGALKVNKHIKANDFGGGSHSKPPSQILPIGSNSSGYVGKLSAVSAISSSHTSSTCTSFGPAHTQSAETSVPAPGHADSINIHHSKRLSRVLKSATAWAEEGPQVTVHEIPAPERPSNDDSIASSNLNNHEPTAPVDAVAEMNDRILQERLQEAKSLSRRTDCGAVMHSFSLWSKKDNDSNKSCAIKDNSKSTSSAATSSSATGTTPSHKNTSSRSSSTIESSAPIEIFAQTFPTSSAANARLRGPKARVREFQLLNGVQHESQPNPGEQGDRESSRKASLDDNSKSQSGHKGLPNLLRSKIGDSKKGGEDKSMKPDDMDLAGRDKQDHRASKANGSFTSRYRRILQTQDDDSSSSNDVDIPTFEPVPALNSTYPNPTAHRSKQQLHPIIYKGSLAFGTSSLPEKDSDMVVEDSVSVADEESVDIYEKSCYVNNSNTIPHFDNTGNMNMDDNEEDDDDVLSEMSDNDDINFNRNNHYNTDPIRSNEIAAAGYIDKDSKVHPSSKMQQTVTNVYTVNMKSECVSGEGAGQKKVADAAGGPSVLISETSIQFQWEPSAVIGEGTFGKVFLGRNVSTGESLAVKQLYLVDGSDQEVESIRKEIKVMWKLDHRNIVRYLGTSKTERYLYILLEYVAGGSLANMLKSGPLSEPLIQEYGMDIVSGVCYLHQMGILHRDIKCANILITLPSEHCKHGSAKLADFGCSKQLADMCTASLEESLLAIRGSVPWMAPEVIKQSGHGRPSDIWSVGATFIEMATGKPPWPEFTSNLAALFHVATSKSPPPVPDSLSQGYRDLIQRCVMIEPSHRATASELLQACSHLGKENSNT